MTGSIGVDIAMVVDEVRRLRTDLQSAKARAEDAITQLHHMHTGLSGANSCSDGAKSEARILTPPPPLYRLVPGKGPTP
jgi:hypothetical protein